MPVFQYKKLPAYCGGLDGGMEIVPEEAKTVWCIYRCYVERTPWGHQMRTKGRRHSYGRDIEELVLSR